MTERKPILIPIKKCQYCGKRLSWDEGKSFIPKDKPDTICNACNMCYRLMHEGENAETDKDNRDG